MLDIPGVSLHRRYSVPFLLWKLLFPLVGFLGSGAVLHYDTLGPISFSVDHAIVFVPITTVMKDLQILVTVCEKAT